LQVRTSAPWKTAPRPSGSIGEFRAVACADRRFGRYRQERQDPSPDSQFTGESRDRIDGTAFEITDAEVVAADKYEISAYKRIVVTLVSGIRAWVYVDARYTPET
jgi:hypothetical protein